MGSVILIDKDEAEYHHTLRQAIALHQSGNGEMAIRLYKSLLNNIKPQFDVVNLLAICLLQNEKIDEGLDF